MSLEGSAEPRCRACDAPLRVTFVDLGDMPMANSYLRAEDLGRPEPKFPLHARVCENCLLVQIEAVASPEAIFDNYAYFSSYSVTWVEHARAFAEMARRRFALDQTSQVVEIASNDGYLLQHFRDAGVGILGVEPAANVAEVARANGIPTEVRYFGTATAAELRSQNVRADLVVANNVLAHVPDLNDFVAGLSILLAPEGVLSVEFPHLLQLIARVEFDTIYHEHFSYFSLLSAQSVLASHGIRVFDVEKLSTHGGSLRLLACHQDAAFPTGPAVERTLAQEREAGLDDPARYQGFGDRVEECGRALRGFLDEARRDNRSVAAYGAAAKGNTLLNYVGAGTGDIQYVADRSPHKQGRYLPGSRLPIVAPKEIERTQPDYVLVLAWNLVDEIAAQLSHVRDWGGQFVVPIPTVGILR